jgi:protein-S-isoprenylcysteine O-methyltransferase Ste14
MSDTTFKIVFLIGLIVSETIRFPHRKRNQRERKQQRLAEARTTRWEFALDMLAFLGMEIIPLVYVFSAWLDFADYSLPDWLSWLGVPMFALGLLVLRQAHADLGRNWSPTLEITEQHALVTQGIYRHVRHPIYAAIWLMCLAQALLLHNWLAGWAGLICFLPVYMLRVPREEQMMLDHFGEEYRHYMQQTGRVVPRLER